MRLVIAIKTQINHSSWLTSYHFENEALSFINFYENIIIQ